MTLGELLRSVDGTMLSPEVWREWEWSASSYTALSNVDLPAYRLWRLTLSGGAGGGTCIFREPGGRVISAVTLVASETLVLEPRGTLNAGFAFTGDVTGQVELIRKS